MEITKEYLYDEYVVKQKSSTKIASEVGCHYMTILQKLKFFDIPRRKDGVKYPFLTEEFLLKEYVENKKGTMILAKEFKCPQSVIVKRLKKFNIETRKPDSFNDLSGKKFGEWTVIERKNKKDQTFFVCACSCGKEYEISRSNLISGNSTCCKYCSNSKYLGVKNKSWKGHEEISGSFWCRIKASAKKRKISFDLKIQYIWDLFLEQNRKCALTGSVLYFPKNAVDLNDGNYTTSLDRINSSLGYIVGNVQWVDKNINRLKSDFDEKTFIEMCKSVSDYVDYKGEK